jgi:3-hydroxyacyl-[acyl-carrier-protein] dehydratase
MARSFLARVSIPDTHPALPGHFPGRPVVPGVVLLDHVVAAAEAWLQQRIHVTAIKQVKFLAPLLPREEAIAELTLDAAELRFTIKRGDDAIAQGAYTVSLGAAA